MRYHQTDIYPKKKKNLEKSQDFLRHDAQA